jgi:exopolyphosphatase/guanosine-5'-triphosphate,3'-diphosphate pyrophosphatase
VADQAAVARQLGASRIRAVATAAIRRAPNWAELVAAVRDACGIAVSILSEEEEARLAFAGAVRGLEEAPDGEVAVVDVGGGSTEVAVGRPDRGMAWSRSLSLGSGVLTRQHVRADPPARSELEAVGNAVETAFAGLDAPEVACVFAVGGSATSLWALAGEGLDESALRRALEAATAAPAKAVARRLGLDARRVRLLPAGILILSGAAEALAAPMSIGRGGLREGVVIGELELASMSP